MLAGRESMDRINHQRASALRCIPSLDAFTRREALTYFRGVTRYFDLVFLAELQRIR